MTFQIPCCWFSSVSPEFLHDCVLEFLEEMLLQCFMHLLLCALFANDNDNDNDNDNGQDFCFYL